MILSKSRHPIDSVFNHYSFGFVVHRYEFQEFAAPYVYDETYAGCRGVEIEIMWGREMSRDDFP